MSFIFEGTRVKYHERVSDQQAEFAYHIEQLYRKLDELKDSIEKQVNKKDLT